MPHLSLSFLGGFEAALDGESITAFGTDKVRALLAYVAIESARPHRRAELAALLWPDLPDNKAAHNVSQTLLRLRRALRDESSSTYPFLVLNHHGVQFNPRSDYQVDVTRFGELLKACRQHQHPNAETCPVCAAWLQQAAELYRGDLLAGLFVRGSIGFEEWRIVKHESLHGQAVAVLDQLAAYHERCEEYDQMQDDARRQVALEPWREEAHLQLMRALALRGQSAAAVEQYEGYRRTLVQELGSQPSAEATALYEQIQSGNFRGRRADRPAARQGQNERRQVTALVCSRGNPATRGDPEELYEQLAFCEWQCGGILTRFDGQRAPRHGGECLIYFGYPMAHEDDARRAVYAGLAMAATPPSQASPVRIGIHTGLMVVSNRRGPGAPDRELVGDVPGLARACHDLAEPGDVLMTEDTERLVRGWFEREPLGPQTLMGLARSVEVYRATSSLPGRLDWFAQTQHLTPFIGREADLAQVTTCLEKALHGQGQTVLVSGQAGIGKSRLVWELKNAPLAQMEGGSMLWLESHCSPYYQNTSLYPIIRLLEQLLGFEEDDSPDLKRDKLARTLARFDLNHSAALWHLSLLLGLPDEGPLPPTITAEQRERMRAVFVALLQKQAAERPLALTIEDLHYSDPSTVEWLDRSFDSLAAAPCLVLLTCRPTFTPAWLPRAQLIPLTLGPLSPVQTERLVSELASDGVLREDVRRRIVTQTDGIPLFVEELTKTLIQTFEVSETSKVLKIPATLRDSLMARLDHLGEARETAQWAAALGREFSYPVLSAVTAFDERRLQNDLARLVEAELIFPQGRAAHANYAFKHALVQEAAQASLLKRAQQDYHRRIAETLEARFIQIAETQPEVIAQHYTQAGLNAQGADYWTRAGERAAAQGATVEANIFFDRALELIEPIDHERRWQALLGHENVLDLRGERAAQETDLTALLELAEVLDDDTRRAQVYLRQTAYAAVKGDYRATVPLAEAASAAARRAGNLTLELRALAYKAQTLTFFGEMTAARQIVDETLAQAHGVADDSVRALILTVAAHYYLESGDLFRAAQLQSQSAEAAQQSRNHTLEITIDANLGLIYATSGLYAQALAILKAGMAHAEALGDRRLRANTMLHLGYVHWRSGDQALAQQIEEQALEELIATGDAYGEAACRAYLGYIFEGAGNLALAAQHLTQAHTGFARIGVDPDRFEAQAIEARVALAQGQREEARQLALAAWNYLREHGTGGMDFPSGVYAGVADVFRLTEAAGSDVSARKVIEAGYRELMARAEKISDPLWRRSFLENEPSNRALVERWKQYV